MEQDEVVLSLAVQRGLLSAAQAGQARAAAAAQRVPLRSLLVRAVPPQALAELVAEASSSSSSVAAGTPSRGVGRSGPGTGRLEAAPAATTRFDAGERRPGDERGRLVDGLRALRRQDPRFAPHAELVFEVVARLGEGGMGVVERVRDARLGREAALKRMRSGGEAPEVVARFWREVEVTARLDHPSIPPVYEAGTDAAGRPYLLMRVIEGESLADAIGRAHAGPPPPLAELRHLLEALLKVAEAVAYAHSRGVIHRDLKPANIMVGRFGEVLVMDWGLARVGPAAESARDDEPLRRSLPAAEEAPLGATIAGSTLGTPGYMPPEQASGEVVDARADVFALGAILVELLTGRPPVEGSTPLNRIAATVQGRIATPRSRRPELPRDLDGIAARALAPGVEARTPDAATFVGELRAVLADELVPGHRYGPGERAGRFARRRPGLLVGGLAAAVAANVLVAAGLSARASEQRRADAVREQAKAEAASRAMEEALDALAEASDQAHRGRADAVKAAVARALGKVPRPPFRAIRFAAAEAYAAANLPAEAKEQLEAAIAEHPPGARELVALHRLWLVSDPAAARLQSPYEWRLVAAVEQRGDAIDADLRHLARGMRHAERSELPAARAELEKALAANPSLTVASIALGEVLIRLADEAAALALFERALKGPAPPRERAMLLTLRAQVWLVRGDLALAEADLTEALGAFPGLVTAMNLRAGVLMKRGRLDEAAEVLRAMGDNPMVNVTWANLLSRKQDFQGALAWVDKALAADPRDADALAVRAGLRLQTRDHEGALADAEASLAAHPSGVQALLVRCSVRAARRDLAGAEADARRACELLPTQPSTWQLLAQVLQLKGDPEGAQRALEEAGKHGSADVREVDLSLAAIAQRGDRQLLEAEVDKALRINPDHPVALMFRADLAGQRGAYAAGLADADRAIALKPDLPHAYDIRGGLRLALGDPIGARTDFDRAIELGSRQLRTLTTRATLRYNENDLEGAMADVEMALARDPRCADAYYVRAGVKQRKGDAPGCREDLERFLELAPSGDPRAQQLRQKLGKP